MKGGGGVQTMQDPILKEECDTNYKKYRNLLSALMKKSKQAYYDIYFERIIELLFIN